MYMQLVLYSTVGTEKFSEINFVVIECHRFIILLKRRFMKKLRNFRLIFKLINIYLTFLQFLLETVRFNVTIKNIQSVSNKIEKKNNVRKIKFQYMPLYIRVYIFIKKYT